MRVESGAAATMFLCLGLIGIIGPAPAAGAPADSLAARDSAAADSARAPRIVREFPAYEVSAPLYDLRSSQTVHEISGAALRAYPVDGLVDVVALQPGVVAQAEELHVRGGRAGETVVSLDGLTLNEPLRHRPMELPLLALQSVDLISGAPESRYPGSLAGILDLHTVDPGERLAGEWRWQTDGGLDTRYDRWSGRVSTPLPILGLGVVAAADATLDDTWLPSLRSPTRHRVAGLSLGWRDENRILGYLKVATVAAPRRVSLQVLASRRVSKPYDPMWSLDGWVGFDGNGFVHYSPDPLPGYQRYRAADHLAITDDRQLGTLLTLASVRGSRRATLGLGWLRTRTARTPGGVHEIPDAPPGVVFSVDAFGDPFHVHLGDDPLYRVSGSDVYTLRGDVESAAIGRGAIKTGVGLTYEDVRMDELDVTLFNQPRLDSLRAYHATAPGGFAYAQGRWESGGLVLNAGLRAEYFTAGPQADDQTLPGSTRGHLSLSPRVGIAYPISPRDIFSMAYVRMQQDPARDLLYDQRRGISNRQPLGNPALQPARILSYEAAVKHVISTRWALQTSFFYRDLAQVAGARTDTLSNGEVDLLYTDEDQASAAGLELSLIHARDERHRLEVHYAFMHAWGFESRPEGDPYGPVREVRTAPISEQPLSWDRRHSLLLSGTWGWRDRLSLSWSTIVGSALPWTPKSRRQPLADVTVVNSRRFQWTEVTNVNVHWSPPYVLGFTFGLEARNVFGTRGERAATVDGYPNPAINTVFDDYGAYRTETGVGGGAYWTDGGGTPHWVPVHDPRLFNPPRALRASVGKRW